MDVPTFCGYEVTVRQIVFRTWSPRALEHLLIRFRGGPKSSLRSRPMVGGATSVGIGYLMVGGAGYLFLAVASRVFDQSAYSALTSVYLMANIIGPGLFSALEQETSRNVSIGLVRAEDVRPVVRQLGLISGVLFAAVAVVTLALSPVLLSGVLRGHVLLLVGLLVASGSYAAVSITRGVFGGKRAFGRYATSIGVEGGSRLAVCLVLGTIALTGVVAISPHHGAGAYGLLFCVAPLISVLATARWFANDLEPFKGRRAVVQPIGKLLRGVGLLTVGSALSMAIANGAPVVVSAVLANDPGSAGIVATFASAVVLARIPLFVFQGAQPLVLPSFARAAARAEMDGDVAPLRRAIKQALLLVLAAGVLALLVAAGLGHWLGQLAFGPTFDGSSGLISALMVGTVASMAIQIAQPALLALSHHRWVAVGWTVGAATFAAAFTLPFSAVTDAVIAQLVSAATTVGVLGVVLFRALGRISVVSRQTQEFSDVQRP
jgi:O-antigen/teichoic acid export membrane protein